MNYHRLLKPTRFSVYPRPLASTTIRKGVDGACVYEEKTVIHELTQGIQMAKQLRANLHSAEARDFLIPKILSSYDNALFVLKSGESAAQPPAPAFPAVSPPDDISIGSLGSEVFKFDQPFPIQQGQNVISKKRKGSTPWEKQARIFSENGLEDDFDDGYNWRKYGQKDILGAKFPRSYYRCSYSKVQKCMATKQVQITDACPTIFDIAYKGKHTCSHGAQLASPPPPPTLPEKNEITPTDHHHQPSLPNPVEMLSNPRANLSVDTTVLGSHETVPSPLSFTSASSELMDDLQQFLFPDYYDNDLLQDDSPPFFSPATSETNFFTEWGSSSSLDFLAGPDIDTRFEFMNSFF